MRNVRLAIILAAVLLAAAAHAQPQARSQVFLPALSQPQGEAAPQNEVYVRDVRTFVSSLTGSRYVVGEVLNGTAAPAYAAQVEIQLLDAGGQVLLSSVAYPLIARLDPGERAGFVWVEFVPPAGVVRAQARVAGWEESDLLGLRPISVVTSRVEPVDGGLQVMGQVRNEHTATLSGARIAVTFYDEAGRVLDVADGFPSSTTMRPGETLDFTISTFRVTGASRIAVDAEGYVGP